MSGTGSTFMKNKINNIQALRAFAAVAVVSFHTGFIFPHMRAIGSFGVDIFFVISGYIMARILETDSSFFLRRRLIRIVPPYWAMTVLLFLAAWRYPRLMGATRASGVELVKSLFFIPYYKSSGLLRPLLFVGWSLNYEMFFYVAIAAGLLLIPRRPLVAASGIVLVLVALCHPFMARGALPAFYGNWMMLEFVLGILAYEIARRVPVGVALRDRTFSLVLLLATVAGQICLQGIEHSPLPSEWVPRELLSFLMILSASLLSQGSWDLRVAWVVLIGDASYILYLIHPYIEYFTDRVFAKRLPWLAIQHPLGSSIVSMISIGVAILVHLRLERPLVAAMNRRFGGNRRSTEFKGLAPDAGLVTPLAGAALRPDR